jgi:hypothetical protein
MVGCSHPPGTVLLAWLLLAATAAGGPGAPRGPEDVWAELGTNDPEKADQLTAYLVARPGLALPLLRQRLRPVCLDPGQLPRLIADLDHRRFAVRERASRELERLEECAEGALCQARTSRPSAEVRRRIDLLLERLRTLRLFPSAERRRLSRAVDVLEQIGSPEAREILAGLARGFPAADLTVEAKAALERMPRPPAQMP